MSLAHTQLAILGGPQAVTIDQTEANRWPIITDEDINAVTQLMRHGKLARDPVIKEFENDCMDYFKVKHVLAHANGTAALLASFFSLGLEPGDEVLVPSVTFWASVVPMLWVGLIPVFCEIEPDCYGICPQDIIKKITPKTRAIVVTHLFGMPAKMAEITAIAKQYQLKIIEDASHAHGAKWRDQYCGTLGDVNAMSIMGTKLLPVGEGGLLLTNQYELFEKAICLGDISRIIDLPTPARRFAVTSFGIKTRISSMAAALGRSQLKHLTARNQKRNNNIEYLSNYIEGFGFDTFMAKPDYSRVYYEYNIRYDDTERELTAPMLVAALKAEGCDISIPQFPILHDQPLFTEGHYQSILRLPHVSLPDYDPNACPISKQLMQQLIRLPIFPSASLELMEQYRVAFEKVMSQADKVIAWYHKQQQANEQAIYSSTKDFF